MQPLGADEPTVVGPYRLLGRLGSGGMGRVYLGRSPGGRTVAVKIVHPHFALDEEFRARFRREVQAARRVGGAWTAPVLEADPEAPVPWVATAYAAGPSLTTAVADGGPLPAHTVRALGAGLAEALTAVHALGLVHRDVKPSNVLLTLDGPLLIDFGIARATDGTASLTSTGVSIGSPGYMAPEQILGKGVTGASDVFSLGAVLTFASTGAPPFQGDSSAALLYKVVHEEPELGGLDGELRRLASACLAKDPAARPTPSALAEALAPGGAARLVAGGWLPGALVERVSRSAVRLLNLDATDEGTGAGAGTGGGAGAASGPVDFSRPAVLPGNGGSGGRDPGADSGTGPGPDSGAVPGPGPDSDSGSVTPSGVFGPPPVMSTAGTAGGGPGSGHLGHHLGHSGHSSPNSGHHPDHSGHSGHPGRFSVSVAATSAPAASGRGRRLSCTVALAVAGAMAAVTVASVLVLDLLPGGTRHDNGDSPHSKAPTPANSGGATGAAARVPERYVGTWEGEGTVLDGAVPAGTFRLTVRRVRVGEELGRITQTDHLGASCTDVLTLKQITEKQVVASSAGVGKNGGHCNQDTATVRLSPVGDDLGYVSDSKASGYPEARMTKVE